MFYLNTLFYVYLILYFKLILVFSSNACSNKTFSLSPEFNDLKPAWSPVKEFAGSKIECANRCYSTDSCRTFFFSNDNQCFVYNTGVYKSMFLHHLGLRRYDLTTEHPSDCDGVMKKGNSVNGIYTIQPRDGGSPFSVFCDLTSHDGGWLVIQRRIDGSLDFYKSWNEYKDGFGNLDNEMWFGNTKIHRITSQGLFDLRVDLEGFDGTTAYAEYNNFSLASEQNHFQLRLDHFSGGTAEDSLKNYHNDLYFSTRDKDLDTSENDNCSDFRHGAWWYNHCGGSNLNGRYYGNADSDHSDSILWYSWKQLKPLKRTVMKIRPLQDLLLT